MSDKWDKLNKELDDALESTFVKTDKVDGEWLSPIATERAWQEEQLVNIFGHYPNASPRWQYMNGLIQNSLQQERMYSEEDMEKAFKVGFSNGFASDILSTEKLQKEKERLFYEWFKQFKKK